MSGSGRPGKPISAAPARLDGRQPPAAPGASIVDIRGRGASKRKRPPAFGCHRTPSSDQAEEGTDLVDEQLRLFEGGEVAALVELIPVADVEESPRGPAARR